MANIAIVTDSTANLPMEVIKQYNIHVVPVLLHWDGQTLRDGLDIAPAELYRRLRESTTVPTTSSPSVGDFLRTYAALSQKVDGIVSIHVSPKLSAIYQAAVTASGLIDEVPIKVMDCQSAAMAQGFVVLEAAKAAASGASLEEVVRRAESVIPRVRLYAFIETLEHLHRSGRVPAVATLLGSVFQVRPIFTLKDGVAHLVDRPRTRAKATQRILELMAADIGGAPVHVAIFHADAPEDAAFLQQEIARRFRCLELYVTEFTPVMGSHTGPGLLGVAFYTE